MCDHLIVTTYQNIQPQKGDKIQMEQINVNLNMT
jgi:hypothetical protein